MTDKERVIRAIRHEQTDIIPYTVDLYVEVREKLKAYYNDPDFERKIDNHLCFTSAGGFPREGWVAPGIWRDHFGVEWDRRVDKNCGVVRGTLFDEDTFDAYVFPDPDQNPLYLQLEKTITAHPDKFLIASVAMSYFERSWSLYGMENTLMDLAGNEEFAFKMLDRILEYNLKLIDRYLRYDVDCVHINDDYGQQNGLIMGARLWRKFYKPGLKAMAEQIKAKGKYVYLHSCGNIAEIIPDLIEIGVDIINPLQPEVMDVFRLKEEYGKELTFHGGVSEQRTLNFGTPDDVEREMREKMEKLGKNGGYILAPSQGMTGSVPVENAARFIAVATSQGQSV